MKVAIVGAGNGGATLAYTLLLRDVATRVSLIDVNRAILQVIEKDVRPDRSARKALKSFM